MGNAHRACYKRRMKIRMLPIIAVACLSLTACSTLQKGPVGNNAVPQPAKSVDVDRYLGRWYELARYEAGFQKDCEAVSADYSLTSASQIKVINSCRKGSVDGESQKRHGEGENRQWQ